MSATVPGISIERHAALRITDPAYAGWWQATKPALYHCVRLEPVDESLRRWRCYRLSIAPPRVYLATIVHTPAGCPDWLVELPRWDS